MATRAHTPTAPDPIDHIVQVNRGRLPALLQRKFAAMALDPFVFLRATAMLGHRAVDAAALPATPLAWVCGDLHLQNFGCFRGSNRLVYFDLNDFDEAACLPASIDLLRLLGSILCAAPGMGIAPAPASTLVAQALEAYGAALARGKAFWLERDTAIGPVAELLGQVARRKRRRLLADRTVASANQRRMRIDGQRYLPVPPQAAVRARLQAALAELARLHGQADFFEPRDFAFRVAGMGSLGVPRYVALVRGRGDPDRNALIDFKFAAPSSAAQALPAVAQPRWAHDAARVVAIQDICQAAAPAYLTALTLDGAPYVVRELQPVEDRIALGPLVRHRDTLQLTLAAMARLCAYAQLRSAGRRGAAGVDALMDFGQRVLAAPRPWRDAAHAVNAANSAAYHRFARAWTQGDARLVRLCAGAPAARRTVAAARIRKNRQETR